jgi:TonB family protein
MVNAYRLALQDSVEAANTGEILSRLGGKPDAVVVLQLKVRKSGDVTLKSIKQGARPDLVAAAMAAVERSAPLLPPPEGKTQTVKLVFLFRNDGKFKLQ